MLHALCSIQKIVLAQFGEALLYERYGGAFYPFWGFKNFTMIIFDAVV